MNKFYPQEIYSCDYGIRATFVSGRLAKIIIKKSIKGEWFKYYFKIAPGEYQFGKCPAVAINTDGLVLCVAPSKEGKP